jgi:hypothetical protein
VLASISTVLYIKLRESKEGVGASQLIGAGDSLFPPPPATG